MTTKQKIKFILIVSIIAWFIAGILFVGVGAAQILFNIDFLNLIEQLLPPTPPVEFVAYSTISSERAWQLVNSRTTTLKPVIIGIVDTGLTKAHPEFFQQVDFGNTPESALFDHDPSGHGTQVTGIIGANNVLGAGLTLLPDSPQMNGIVLGVLMEQDYQAGVMREVSRLS